MILITKDEVNTVYLTLSESVSVTDPVYTFKATSVATLNEIEFELNITETSKRWDACEIDGGLFKNGDYTYEVIYEGDKIEEGILIVIDGSERGFKSLKSYDGAKKFGEYID